MKLKFHLNTLRARLFFLIAIILSFMTITNIYFVNIETDEAMLEALENNARNILTSVKLNVENEYKSIRFFENRLIEIKKRELKNLSELAFSVLDKYYSQYKSGRISLKEAKKNSISDLKKLRYANNIGYFWINDMGIPIPKMIMHPVQSELNGKILNDPKYNRVIGSNENLFKAFVATCRKNGQGFIKYLWYKPKKNGSSEQQPKLSFVKVFEPWKWIIGTGVYIDDINAEVNNRFKSVIIELDETLKNIKMGQSGYLFIFTGSKKLLIHPDLEKVRSDSSKTSRLIINEMMTAAHSGNKTYDYKWGIPQDNDTNLFRKRAFVEYFKPLDWYIVSSVYYDEVELHANQLQTKIYLIAALSLILSFILTLKLSRNITLPLKQLVESAKNIGKENTPDLNTNKKGSVEIKELSGVLIDQFSSIKKTTAALRKSEDRLNKTLMAIKDGIWDINIPENKIYFDPMYYKIAGYTPYEFPSKSEEWQKRVHPDDLNYVINLISDHFKGKTELYEAEYRFMKKNGEWMWALGRGQVIERDLDGNAVRFIGTQSDITSRKEIEEKLQKSYELNLKYQETINKTAINLSLHTENFEKTCKIISETVTQELQIEHCRIWMIENENLMKCVNTFPESTQKEKYSFSLPIKNFSNYFSALKSDKVIATSNAQNDPRTKEFNKDFLIPGNITSMLDVSINLEGKMIGIICIGTTQNKREWLPEEISFTSRIADQTALAFLNNKRLEAKAELQKSEEELLTANEELQSILYVASHDLRSPLVNITGFSAEIKTLTEEIEEYLLKTYNFKKDKTYLELKKELSYSTKLIHLNTTKMESLLKGLLRLSRLGKSALNLKKIDVNKLVQKIILGMNYQIEQSGATIETEKLPFCYSDETITGQIFTNLLDNAVKYLAPERKGLIKIYCSNSTKYYITYCVEDNGIGIKKEHQSKIFEMFHRLEPNSAVEGIGIGLTIIQKMIKKLNGYIHLDSVINKGSRFYVTFPSHNFE